MTSVLVQHTFMINLLNRKIGTGVWNVKQGLLSLFGKSNGVGPWRKRHASSLNSNCYTTLHQNVFSYNRQAALWRKVIPFSGGFWYTLALCFITVWSKTDLFCFQLPTKEDGATALEKPMSFLSGSWAAQDLADMITETSPCLTTLH